MMRLKRYHDGDWLGITSRSGDTVLKSKNQRSYAKWRGFYTIPPSISGANVINLPIALTGHTDRITNNAVQVEKVSSLSWQTRY